MFVIVLVTWQLAELLPLLLPLQVVRGYIDSTRRLIVLGYNATLTTAVEAPRQPKRHYDQIKALTRVNPRILKCLEVGPAAL